MVQVRTPESLKSPDKNILGNSDLLSDNADLRGKIESTDSSGAVAVDQFLDKHGRSCGLEGDRDLSAVQGGTKKVDGSAVQKHDYFTGSHGNTLEEGNGATALALAEDMEQAARYDRGLREKAEDKISALNRGTAEERIANVPEVVKAQGGSDSELDLAAKEKQEALKGAKGLQAEANGFMDSMGIDPTETQISVASNNEDLPIVAAGNSADTFAANEVFSGVSEDNNTQAIAA